MRPESLKSSASFTLSVSSVDLIMVMSGLYKAALIASRLELFEYFPADEVIFYSAS